MPRIHHFDLRTIEGVSAWAAWRSRVAVHEAQVGPVKRDRQSAALWYRQMVDERWKQRRHRKDKRVFRLPLYVGYSPADYLRWYHEWYKFAPLDRGKGD